MTVHGKAGQPCIQASPDAGRVLHAEPGDALVIDGAGMAGLPRIGTIIAVPSQDGTPPFVVRWIAGDYVSKVSPGPGAHVEKRR
jgi:hypothetical protein